MAAVVAGVVVAVGCATFLFQDRERVRVTAFLQVGMKMLM